MADFMIDCYFNGFCKGRKHFVLTLRYAKKLCAMWHSGESTPRYAAKCGVVFCSRIEVNFSVNSNLY
jgi:hypothetical protein